MRSSFDVHRYKAGLAFREHPFQHSVVFKQIFEAGVNMGGSFCESHPPPLYRVLVRHELSSVLSISNQSRLHSV
jgi:hypothetical protein